MKNNMLKLICLVLVLVVALSSFAGCNPNEASNASSELVSSVETDPAPNDETSSVEPEEPEETEEPNEDIYEKLEEQETEKPNDYTLTSAIDIFNANPVQSNFGGFNAVYHAYPYRSDDFGREYTTKMAEYEIERAANSGISVARTMYDMNLAWDTKTKTWNWDSEDMNAIYKFCQELDKYGIEVFLSHWESNQYLFTSYHWSDPTPDGVQNNCHEGIRVEGDQAATLEKFGQFMADSVIQLHARGCKNVTSISIATEPGAWWEDDWGDATLMPAYQEKCAKSQADSLNVVSKMLKKNGIRQSVDIIGPNAAAGETERTLAYMRAFYKYIDDDAYDLVSAHRYLGSDMTSDNYYLWQEFATDMGEVLDLNKFVWDEYNTKPPTADAVTLRRTGHNGVQLALGQIAQMNCGIHSSYLWSLFDQQFPNNYSTNTDSFKDGVQMTGLAPTLLVSSIVYAPYYSFSLAANLVGRKGAKIYRGSDEGAESVYAAMSEGKDGSLNILVATTSIEDVQLTLNFEKSLGGKTFYRHVYDPNTVVCTAEGEMIQPDLKIANVKDSLTDTITPYTVVVYTTDRFCE